MKSFVSSFRVLCLVVGLLVACRRSDAFCPRVAETRLSSTRRFASSETPYQVRIEYCTGCRWHLRGFWTAQELLSTFRDDRALGAVTVIPSTDRVGRFVVTATTADDTTVLWDRQAQEGFPEMKELKQLVRNHINPDRYLGHSDSTERREQQGDAPTEETILDLSQPAPELVDTSLTPSDIDNVPTPHVTISYCTGCNWFLRATYLAQELVSTFGEEIHAISLLPCRPPAPGGTFVVSVDKDTVWDRTAHGRFPETKELKQLVRNLLNPDRNLGHIDGKKGPDVEDMDDEEAANARKFFGVM